MASLEGPRGGLSLGLLLWLQLAQPVLSEALDVGYRANKDSEVTLLSPEPLVPPGYPKCPGIPKGIAAPGSSAPAGPAGPQVTSAPTGGQDLWRSGAFPPVELFPRACGKRIMKIVGGAPAPERRWPWQVIVQSFNAHVCGGSLISSRVVLTAAHCVSTHRQYSVKLGTTKIYSPDPNAVVVPVKDVIIHQKYRVDTLTHDIALAVLAHSVNFSSYIQPVCLAEKLMDVKAGTPCWVTGWGRTIGIRASPKPENLQELQVYIVDTNDCKMKINEAVGCYGMGVRKGMMCAYRQQRQSVCWGDSGGPLVCEFNETWIQVGIVSWGVDCGDAPLPTMYTNVSEFRDWMQFILSQAPCVHSVGVCMVLLGLVLLLAMPVTW